MSATSAMLFHRKLWNSIDNIEGDCDTDECVCRTDIATRALFAVIWLHCPTEWHNSIMAAQYYKLGEGKCVTCGVQYPCETLRVVAEEFGSRWDDK